MGPAPGEKTGLPAWQTHALENLPNSSTVASYSRVSGGVAPGLFAFSFLPLRPLALLAPFAWPRSNPLVQLCLSSLSTEAVPRQYRGSAEGSPHGRAGLLPLSWLTSHGAAHLPYSMAPL